MPITFQDVKYPRPGLVTVERGFTQKVLPRANM